MASLDPTFERVLTIAGWSAIVILWHTTLVALSLATWRASRARASATAQYRAGLAALMACVVLSTATPLVLVSVPRVSTNVAASPVLPRVAAAAGSGERTFSPTAIVRHPLVQPPVSFIGGVWIAASLIALARLAGGWVLARWIRRRATTVAAGTLDTAVSSSWALPSAMVLSSTHVEAPVVVGHRAPAILLPHDAAAQLDADALAPLIAHELAHVARSDYAVNVAQSIAEALLVLSPAVHWIARRIRDAREYCCDDLVVARYGHRPYVNALATLAGLGVAPRGRPALNVAGPRLIVRIRRLLQEDSMVPFSGYRVAGVVAAFTLVGVAGSGLVPLSASALAQGPSFDPVAVPLGFEPEPEGASVTLASFVSSTGGVCGTARIENRADVALVSVSFAGVLSETGESDPLFVKVGEEIPVDVAPGASETVDANLLTPSDLSKRLVRGQLQATCILAQTRFANGFGWGRAVRARAIEADTRIRFPNSDIPRALVDAPSTSGSTAFCFDDRARGYSQGAIVAVRYEPGRFASCRQGAWTDYHLPGPSGPVQ